MFGETTSLPLLPSQCGPFMLYWGGTIQLVFRSFSEGIAPNVEQLVLHTQFVCPWEGVSLQDLPTLPS